MNEREAIADAVAERWLARTIDSYPEAARASLRNVSDPFRNPAGFALKENLKALSRELLGAMDKHAIERAMDEIVRLRVLQSPGEVPSFIGDLRVVVAEMAAPVAALPADRIDVLLRMEAEKFASCRAQIEMLRQKEQRLRAQWEAQ